MRPSEPRTSPASRSPTGYGIELLRSLRAASSFADPRRTRGRSRAAPSAIPASLHQRRRAHADSPALTGAAVPSRDRCIFCRIAAGTAPSHPVREDAQTLAFMDLSPLATGHVLVIPKPHWENLFEIPAPALAAVMDAAKRVAHAIRATIAPPGLGVYQVNGRAAGQTVFHYHVHLIPRHRGISLDLHGRRQAERSELDRVAQWIRTGLEPTAG